MRGVFLKLAFIVWSAAWRWLRCLRGQASVEGIFMHEMDEEAAELLIDVDGDGVAETVTAQVTQLEDGTNAVEVDVDCDGVVDLIAIDGYSDGDIGEDELYKVMPDGVQP